MNNRTKDFRIVMAYLFTFIARLPFSKCTGYVLPKCQIVLTGSEGTAEYGWFLEFNFLLFASPSFIWGAIMNR